MRSSLSLAKTINLTVKVSLLAVFGVIGMFWAGSPVFAHHPLDGKAVETFNSIEGLVSGLAHQVLGVDH